MTIETWEDLNFWGTGEWQVIGERLDDMDRNYIKYNPERSLLFAALDACSYADLRVCILGQDPYPDHASATGLAFSIPRDQKEFPPSLQNIMRELKDDLGLEKSPEHGDLSVWAEQGVLLWNAIPSCQAGKPGSHRDWFEWDFLTKEIIQACSDKGIVFGLLGNQAYSYRSIIDEDANSIVFANHPSPLAVNRHNLKHPFIGSRFFTTINLRLAEMKLGNIDWRL
jgi:uracil-DNA glycosylase